MAGRDARPGDDQLRERRLASVRPRVSLWMWRNARKVVVSVIGGTVILFGVALLVLPGPGLVTIVLGLAILATEYAFARRWLRMAKERGQSLAEYAHLRQPRNAEQKEPPCPGKGEGPQREERSG